MATLRSQRHSVVGLDIEPSYLAAAEVKAAGHGSISVERAATAPLSPGLMRDGEVTDVEALAVELRTFFREHKLSRRVRVGVANQRIVMRTIDMPRLGNPKDLATAIRFQAQEHVPMPLDQAVLEHQTLGDVETPDGPRTRVVLVAARRDMVSRLLAAVRQAGLRPEGIDLSAFAMIRALGAQSEPEEDGAAVLYVGIGGLTNLAVALGKQCVFTRVMAGGLEGMAVALAERRGLTLADARLWLEHVGLQTPAEEVEGEEEIVSEARAVLIEGVERVADEIRQSLDFYATQLDVPAVRRAMVCGPALAVPGFLERLGEALGIPVTEGRIGEAVPGGLDAGDSGRLAVAAGLAVEERSA